MSKISSYKMKHLNESNCRIQIERGEEINTNHLIYGWIWPTIENNGELVQCSIILSGKTIETTRFEFRCMTEANCTLYRVVVSADDDRMEGILERDYDVFVERILHTIFNTKIFTSHGWVTPALIEIAPVFHKLEEIESEILGLFRAMVFCIDSDTTITKLFQAAERNIDLMEKAELILTDCTPDESVKDSSASIKPASDLFKTTARAYCNRPLDSMRTVRVKVDIYHKNYPEYCPDEPTVTIDITTTPYGAGVIYLTSTEFKFDDGQYRDHYTRYKSFTSDDSNLAPLWDEYLRLVDMMIADRKADDILSPDGIDILKEYLIDIRPSLSHAIKFAVDLSRNQFMNEYEEITDQVLCKIGKKEEWS